MHHSLIELLECPACHGALAWQIGAQDERRIQTGAAQCTTCMASYPVRDGIGLFLTPDLPRDDLWGQVESRLGQYLRENPEIERRLIGVPLETLNPADRFCRALALEERQQFAGARNAEQSAQAGLYSPEALACWQGQVEYVLQSIHANPPPPDTPIVDLASGRGYLAERLAQSAGRPVVVTDFSPPVLRRDRRWFEFFGLYEQISLLAFDARRTPFKDGAIQTLTTNLGLPNIRQAGDLLGELRRITAGAFLAVSQFYPPGDAANATALAEAGLSELVYRRPLLESFSQAGWQVEVCNACSAPARPTPVGEVLEGFRVDAFPVEETTLEWCTLVAK